MRYSRKIFNEAITWIMGIIFICCICAGPDNDPLIMIPLLGMSGGWLFRMVYINGWVMNSDPWNERQKHEETNMH